MTSYAREIEPFWLDLHEIDLPLRNLPSAFDGFRLAQLTDLHLDDHVPIKYMQRVVQRINDARVDAVAVTGDVVNHDLRQIDSAAELLGGLRSPVVVSYGNHDYAPFGARPGAFTIIADPLEKRLTQVGCRVLRNRAAALRRGNQRLWFVGIEDFWSTLFNPPIAFAGRSPARDTMIALSHNPDSAPHVIPFGPKLILSGHTHGGQLRIPLVGAPILPIIDRRYDQGLFELENDCKLYVSRGVGFLMRARFWCRPEVPVFVLRRN
jgi:predicted MPP superfamily phosphohydrolase